MKHRLSELIDVDAFAAMMQSFYEATGIPHGLIDVEHKLLSGAGWQDVCTKCHRAHPATLERCRESDSYIAEHLLEQPFIGYRCLNGLIDYATAIVVEGEHLATLFVGQLFHEPPDLEFFRTQAQRFGFDEERYLAYVKQVPVVPKAQIEPIMAFYAGLARMLASSGLDRLRQRAAEDQLATLNATLARQVKERTAALTRTNEKLCCEVTERKAMEEALRHEKRFSDDIITSLPGVFYMFDTEGRFVRWNARLVEVSGYSNQEIAALHPLNFFTGEDVARIGAAIQQAFDDGEVFIEAELVTKGGDRIPYYFSGRRTMLNGEPYLIGLGVDITDRVALEHQLEHQANTDLLTGLASRRHFMERAEHEVARSRRYGGPLSVLMLDLDGFKAINDTHGHRTGDLVLKRIGQIFRDTQRAVDIAGRIGGEEFATLLPQTGLAQALELAERLRTNIGAAELTLAAGGVLRFTASIGVATLTRGDAPIDVLLNLADQALYRAKHAGRNRVESVPPSPYG